MTLVGSHGLANRPGKPYPATFRRSVDPPGIEPGFPVCRTGVLPLDDEPISGPPGSRTPITWVQTKRPPIERAAHFARGPSGNRTRSPSLPRRCAAGTPTDPSDPGWTRTIVFLVVTQVSPPLDYGIVSVTEAGVEPAKSPRSGHHREAVVGDRFACLRTRAWRVRELHPAVQAYETRLSLRPPASCRPRYRAGRTGLMTTS